MYAQPTLNGSPSAPSSYSNPDTFGATSVRIIPLPATYQSGYLAGQGFPAENENYLMYNLTLAMNAVSNDLSNIHAEILNVLTVQGISPNGTSIQLDTAIGSKVTSSINTQTPLQPLTNPITTNTTYTIPSNIKSAIILIPATLLKAGTGGPWLLTITSGSGTTVTVPISASGDTITSPNLMFNIYVDGSGNVSSDAWTISGSNANGTYIKFSDGTMEQCGQVTAISNATGISTPVVFKDTSFQVFANLKTTSANLLPGVGYDITGVGAITLYGIYSIWSGAVWPAPAFIGTISWFAIGRWK